LENPLQFVKTIASREGKPGVEMLLPIQGNEAIFGKLAARIIQLQAAIKRERVYNLLALDYHPTTDTICGANHFTFQVHESNIDVGTSGSVTLLLMSRDGGRLHWPKMPQTVIDLWMTSKQPDRSCGKEFSPADVRSVSRDRMGVLDQAVSIPRTRPSVPTDA
jgi:hypothetical protein